MGASVGARLGRLRPRAGASLPGALKCVELGAGSSIDVHASCRWWLYHKRWWSGNTFQMLRGKQACTYLWTFNHIGKKKHTHTSTTWSLHQCGPQGRGAPSLHGDEGSGVKDHMRSSGHYSYTDRIVCVCVYGGNVGQLKREGVSFTLPHPVCYIHWAGRDWYHRSSCWDAAVEAS